MKYQVVHRYVNGVKVNALYDTDYKDYYVTEDGDVYSTRRNKIHKLKKCKQSKGYDVVWIDGKPRLVQRLMGNAFLGLDLNSKLQMNHINKVKRDNTLSNLEVVTNKQNARHRDGHADYKSA